MVSSVPTGREETITGLH